MSFLHLVVSSQNWIISLRILKLCLLCIFCFIMMIAPHSSFHGFYDDVKFMEVTSCWLKSLAYIMFCLIMHPSSLIDFIL